MRIYITADDYCDYFGTSEIKREILHELSDNILKVTLFGVDYHIDHYLLDNLREDVLHIGLTKENADIYILSPLTFTFLYKEEHAKNRRLIHVATFNEDGLVDEREFWCTDVRIEWNGNDIEFLTTKEYSEYALKLNLEKYRERERKRNQLKR